MVSLKLSDTITLTLHMPCSFKGWSWVLLLYLFAEKQVVLNVCFSLQQYQIDSEYFCFCQPGQTWVMSLICDLISVYCCCECVDLQNYVVCFILVQLFLAYMGKENIDKISWLTERNRSLNEMQQTWKQIKLLNMFFKKREKRVLWIFCIKLSDR